MVRKNVAEILTNHVTFELEAIDRMYLNAYVPSLQTGGGFVYFLKTQLGARVPSTMMVAPMSQRFVEAIERFVETQGVDLVTFEKGAAEGRRRAGSTSPRSRATKGVLFVGKAQEKASVFRTEKRRDAHGKTYPWIIRSTAMVNHYYVYILDRDFGPLFIKFCSYFPVPREALSEWARVAETPADAARASRSSRWTMASGRATTAARVQRIADTLDAAKIDAVFRKWLRRAAASVRPRAPRRRLSLSALDPASRVRPDPGPRPAAHRPLFLRRSHPRESRPRPSRSDAADLRSPRHAPHARALPHARPDRGRRALAARRVQEVQGQAVPQRRPGPSHRNHHQRYLRLRHRSCAPQSARPAGDRLCRQPTVVTRRISEPRLPDRRRPPPRRHVPRPRRTINAPRASGSATAASTRSCTRSVSSPWPPPASAIGSSAITSRSSRVAIRTPTRPAPMTYDLRRLRLHGLIERVPAQPSVSHHPDRRPGRHVLCAPLYAGAPPRLLACSRRARLAPSTPSIGSMPRSPTSCRR